MADAPLPRVTVCICTYKRPAVLADLLDRLVLVAARVRDVARVGVVVVDDDPAATARGVAEAMDASFDDGLTYANTASGNIAIARNQALELGLREGEWLAIIDDDCVPEEDWLAQLFIVQERYGAQCVTGSCADYPPADAPGWLLAQPFLGSSSSEPDGAEREVGHLKNTLISADFLRETGIRFEVPFGREGCEDVMFFYTIAVAGVHHRYAALATVSEKLPAERATYAYQLRRRFWYGTTEARTSVASGRASRSRMALSGVKKAAVGAVGPVRRLAQRAPAHLRWTLAETLQGLGRIAGAAGIKVKHR